MKSSYTPPKYNAVLTVFGIIMFFGIAGFSFINGNEMAPIIFVGAIVASVAIFFMLHVNNLSLDISESEVVVFKGKKEVARYTRSQYNFEILKRRYPGKKSPNLFLVVSNEEEKHEHDISILGISNFKLVAKDLGCQAPDLLGNGLIK